MRQIIILGSAWGGYFFALYPAIVHVAKSLVICFTTYRSASAPPIRRATIIASPCVHLHCRAAYHHSLAQV
ncbi:hypothetical protein BJV74DRAFT_142023 [Russula compacta]|nr:hypothetical protein BJV74DRAFT_142023 [Russula compacta]